MRIIFTRHGESQANIERIISNRDLPHALTTLGRDQAQSLAQSLGRHDIGSVHTSPILRAVQTARIVAEELGADMTISDALREIDCGLMEGRGDQEAWQAYNRCLEAWELRREYDFRIMGGESFNEAKQRFVPYIKELCAVDQGDKGNVLIISHGNILRQMLPLLLINLDREYVDSNPLGNCQCVVAEPGEKSLVCLEWGGGQVTRQ
jgi:broad specificity phosphatase PhoE